MTFKTNETGSIKKVGIVGPECTGKTELAHFLADEFETECVEEYARAYLDNLANPYEPADLTKIAHGQIRLEDEWIKEAHKVLICDTTLHVIKIWSEFKYGKCDDEILQLMKQRDYDLYLLTYIDIPWQDDPQREHPDRRQELWDIYERELSGVSPLVKISGDRETRRKTAMDAVAQILKE